MTTSTDKKEYYCPYCNSDLTQPKSVIRAFYINGTDKDVFTKAHYQPEPLSGLPAGTTCIDTHLDIELDEEIHPDNDKCASCKGDICAETIENYQTYVAENKSAGKPVEPYEDWH